MKIKLCKTCGIQLYRKSRKCPRCKTPVKKITALHFFVSGLILVFPVLFWLVLQLPKEDFFDIPPSQEPVQSIAVKQVKVQAPIKKPEEKGNLTKIYVKGTVVNLRQHPTVQSPTLWKLMKGQQLTQIARSGNWIQVLVDDKGGKRGWVYSSLVGEMNPHHPTKPITQHQTFSAFLKYFEQFNAEIKSQKGTTFFENVEYLDKGIIQVTATGIFLSAPDLYKKKYVGKITQRWSALRVGFPAVVRIVDAKGILRMETNRS